MSGRFITLRVLPGSPADLNLKGLQGQTIDLNTEGGIDLVTKLHTGKIDVKGVVYFDGIVRTAEGIARQYLIIEVSE